MKKGFFSSSLRWFLLNMFLFCLCLLTLKNPSSPVFWKKIMIFKPSAILDYFFTFSNCSTLCWKYKGYSTEITNYVLHMTVKIYYLNALNVIPFFLQYEIGHSQVTCKFKEQTCFDRLLASSPNYFCSELPVRAMQPTCLHYQLNGDHLSVLSITWSPC